jgi:hypothetical protein
MDISFHPPPDHEARRSMRGMIPWWRRLAAWLGEFHKFVSTIVAIAAVTIAIHVWLKGLITRSELDLAVEAAVSKTTDRVLLDIRGDLAIIKTNTGGLPEWRGVTTAKVSRLEDRTADALKLAEKNEGRIDIYLTSRRR